MRLGLERCIIRKVDNVSIRMHLLKVVDIMSGVSGRVFWRQTSLRSTGWTLRVPVVAECSAIQSS
eukprot:4315926-Pyramimonas_sp.AAC.2